MSSEPLAVRFVNPQDSGTSCICGAQKYVYSLRRKEWIMTETNVRIVSPLRHFAKGGMRICYEVEEVEYDGSRTKCIAKLFLKVVNDVKEVDYFGEGETQCLCEEFAKNFNTSKFEGSDRPIVSFLQCHVVRISKRDIPKEYAQCKEGFFSYKTTDTGEVMFVMEPKLNGHFTKYNSNFGDCYEKDRHCKTESQMRRRMRMFCVAEAFSHFTLVDSGGSMLLCDIQGVNDLFTDPQIHTEDGKGLGLGNMGTEGIEKFVLNHKCNEICRGLGLKPFQGARPKNSTPGTGNLYAQIRLQLQEDALPLARPVEQMTDEERLSHALKLSRITY
ncbi:putative Alpha kinase family [Trypanosoma vivax]|uniref:Putative myosin heavy chain kinase A n=1 Tax=Trypanosoma vivax (strain Y486) TaxID=1055687 RepID=G0TZQ5_TRYVY|nr:putative myosin heavy chain kinase A [Trypanosoma vivax]KAH8610813.1 putative Alpha kinase family [Trypanosoma vivax]CCC50083.1 putative myosin heavy chain kinase A [Trypanosoma vivax Y486]